MNSMQKLVELQAGWKEFSEGKVYLELSKSFKSDVHNVKSENFNNCSNRNAGQEW